MTAFLETRPFQYFDIPDNTRQVFIDPKTGTILSGPSPAGVKALIKNRPHDRLAIRRKYHLNATFRYQA